MAASTEQGADDASVEEVGGGGGVGIGTLYRHFPTRQALLEAVYRGQVEALRARASELIESDAPGEALAAWLRALMAFSSTKHSLTSALLATIGKDSDLLSSCSLVICDAADILLKPAHAPRACPHRPRPGRPAARADPGRPAPPAAPLRAPHRAYGPRRRRGGGCRLSAGRGGRGGRGRIQRLGQATRPKAEFSSTAPPAGWTLA